MSEQGRPHDTDAEVVLHERPASVLARRRRVLWAVVVIALLLTAAAAVSTRWIRSPQEVAADAAPPPRTVLTAEVTRQVVRRSVVARGTVEASSPVTVARPEAEGGPFVVSAVGVPVGGVAQAGDVLLALSGRPVVLLPGAVPAYRDLRPGDQGPDVTQLQEALATLGIRTGRDAAGVFGPGTQQGVRELYDRTGYQVPSTTGLGEPESEDVTSARTAAREAEQALEDARLELEAARRSDPTTPEGADVGGLERRVQRAAVDRDAASAALDRARGSNGPILPRAEVAFVPTVPVQVMSVGGALGAPAADPVVVLNAGALLVTAQIDPGQAALVRVGMPVGLDHETSGWTGTGTVASVGTPTPDDAGLVHVAVTVTPDAPLDGVLAGADLRLTVSSASSDGEVLAVPVAAVVASADRSTYVVRADPSGAQEKVVVTVGVSGDGYVEVTPVDGALAEGDLVVTSQ